MEYLAVILFTMSGGLYSKYPEVPALSEAACIEQLEHYEQELRGIPGVIIRGATCLEITSNHAPKGTEL